MFEEIDKNGPYPTTLQGTIEPEAFAKLRKVIVKYGYIAYIPAKEANLAKRIEFLKLNENKEYMECLAQGYKDYAQKMKEATSVAIKHLDIEEANYINSEKEAR